MCKITRLLLLVTIAFVATSCTKSDAYDENALANQKQAEYSAAFTKEFGTIAANQDWGFGTTSAAKTRTPNTNSNEWGNYVDVPGGYSGSVPKGDVTQDEIDKVYQAFSVKTTETNDININWSDFFVQQVWKGTATYTAKNNGSVTGSNHMDYLTAGESDEHINNFNNGDGKIMLMQNSSTSRFGYYNSTDSKMHYEYLIKKIGDNYYVGFDFYANGSNSNQQVDRDYIYNDWIVKISPATYKNAKRIIAEDLGSIGDFDFNDVVFDVAQTTNSDNLPATVITVRAAGGTLPLSIKIGDTEKEVHEALGVPTSTMVNTNNGTVSKPVAIFRLPAYKDLNNDVKIYVKSGSSTYELTTNLGNAPAKICVETKYQWTDERQSIKAKYPEFTNYVKDTSVAWY